MLPGVDAEEGAELAENGVLVLEGRKSQSAIVQLEESTRPLNERKQKRHAPRRS